MVERAAVGPEDGIVVVELSLDVTHEVEVVVGMLRSGAAALLEAPISRTALVERLGREGMAAQARKVADEIEGEARRVHEARDAFRKAKGRKR